MPEGHYARTRPTPEAEKLCPLLGEISNAVFTTIDKFRTRPECSSEEALIALLLNVEGLISTAPAGAKRELSGLLTECQLARISALAALSRARDAAAKG
jgi:hypothetical protein